MVNFQYMDSYGVEDLLHIMELLRAPEGCPWDQEQTHQSIRRNMLEEAYEAVEAIDEEDPEHLKEELGDVLLQVVFHACMAAEEGLFTFDDVVDGVAKKMVFRHPHVFGTVRAEDSVQALDTWDAQKREEKAQRTATDTLEAVARSLPALIRAEKVQIKAAKAGFDWPDREPALDKLAEEVDVSDRRALTCVGVLNETTGGVSDYHAALVYVLETDGEVTVRETEKMSGTWATPAELDAVRDRLETWSQIVLDAEIHGRAR